ncbi:MAG: hypothetical protein ACYDDA_00270 [Acidiferrobacteraceae bacterium]
MSECKTQDQNRRPTAGSPTAGRRWGPTTSGARRSKTRVLALVLALSPLASCTAFAGHHIRVVRSMFLERGVSIDPRALARTKTGGYVIAGTSGGPWALRVNAQGKVQWRYRIPFVPSMPSEMPVNSTFTGAVTLPDDSTLLCGYGEFSPRHHPDLTGLLTHLSPHGRVLSTQTLYPDNNRHYALNYLNHCVRSGKGVVVVGTTMRFRKHGPGTSYVWLLKLDDTGRIMWQKLIPNVGDSQILALPDRQLLLAWIAYYGKTDLVRLDAQGDVTARGSLPGEGALVHPLTAGPTVSVVSALSKPHLHLQTVNAALGEVTHRRGDALTVVTRRAYRLPTGALALFGDTTPPEYGGMLVSSIAWISPHFGHQQVFTFKPWSIWVADAVPTGTPGDFATVREVMSLRHPVRDRNRMGIVLSIVHIQ